MSCSGVPRWIPVDWQSLLVSGRSAVRIRSPAPIRLLASALLPAERRKRGRKMTQASAAIVKIPTESPQPARGKTSRARKTAAAQPRAASRVAGIETRAATGATGKSSSWTSGSPSTRPGRTAAGGGRSGTRTASGSSASQSRRRSCREAGEGPAAARYGRGEHDQARRGPDRLVPQPGTACQWQNGGHGSTRTPSAVCASGSPCRSSARSPARTTRSATHRRSSTPPHGGRGRPRAPDAVRHDRRGH
jgi:hypothetical protein